VPAPAAPEGTYAFPVVADPMSYHRTHAEYPATDIFADCGSPVRAVTDAVVLEVSRVDSYDPDNHDGARAGGLFVSILGDDGVRYYGSHLSEVADGIDAGVRVTAGQRVGTLGRTGNSSNVCHLHFGISPPCAQTGDWWIRRGVVWPWSYLDAWGEGVGTSPAGEVAGWHRDRGCPPAP
jgi:murein DD-endopeptidase MepM/ murein hydrolase activator NlpD